MKAWDLVAYDVDGARYCLDCARKRGIDTSASKPACGYGGPVLASDLEDAEYCSDCGEAIGEEEEEEEVRGNPHCPSYVADLRVPDHRCNSCAETSGSEET